MNFFRMMQSVSKLDLKKESEEVFKTLIYFVENSSKIIAPKSKVCSDIVCNWRLSPNQLVDWYSKNGIYKSASTIRSQVSLFSDLLVSCFMPADLMYQVFVSANNESLENIKNRIIALSQSDFSVADLSLDIRPILKYAENISELEDMDIQNAIAFITSIDKKRATENFNTINKKAVASVASVLNEPIIQDRVYYYYNEKGELKESKIISFNSDKMDLLVRMQKLNTTISSNKKPEIKYVYKQENLPYRFLNMSEICETIYEYINEASTSDMSSSGKTIEKSQKFVDIFTDKDKLKKFLHQFNRFDLLGAIDQFVL